MSTQDLLNRVLFHKTAIIKNAIAAIIMVAIFAFEGCFNFATLTWDITKLLTPALWIKTFTKVGFMIAIKTVMLLVFLDVARRLNNALQKAKRKNEEYMKLKGQDFPLYVEKTLNPSIREEEWKKQINAKILKLEMKAKAEDRALYFEENREVEKKNNKYCKARMELDFLISEEYIEKNREYLNVKNCPRVDPAVFDVPVTNEHENKWQMTSKTNAVIIISFVIGSLWLICSQAIWNATGIDKLEDYNALAIAISMLMDLIFMIGNAFSGIMKAFTTVNDQEVVPYVNRNRVLVGYIYFTNPEKKESIDIILDTIENKVDKEIAEELENNKKNKDEKKEA